MHYTVSRGFSPRGVLIRGAFIKPRRSGAAAAQLLTHPLEENLGVLGGEYSVENRVQSRMHQGHNLRHYKALLELDFVVAVDSNQGKDEVGTPADEEGYYHR